MVAVPLPMAGRGQRARTARSLGVYLRENCRGERLSPPVASSSSSSADDVPTRKAHASRCGANPPSLQIRLGVSPDRLGPDGPLASRRSRLGVCVCRVSCNGAERFSEVMNISIITLSRCPCLLRQGLCSRAAVAAVAIKRDASMDGPVGAAAGGSAAARVPPPQRATAARLLWNRRVPCMVTPLMRGGPLGNWLVLSPATKLRLRRLGFASDPRLSWQQRLSALCDAAMEARLHAQKWAVMLAGPAAPQPVLLEEVEEQAAEGAASASGGHTTVHLTHSVGE